MNCNDLVIVRQKDGSFLCSPFYIRVDKDPGFRMIIEVDINSTKTKVRLVNNEMENTSYFPRNVKPFLRKYGISKVPRSFNKYLMHEIKDTLPLYKARKRSTKVEEEVEEDDEEEGEEPEEFVEEKKEGEKVPEVRRQFVKEQEGYLKSRVKQSIERAFYPKMMITPQGTDFEEITKFIKDDTRVLDITFRSLVFETTVNMFVFNHDEKIIVTDIDGTITKSDIRGVIQAMVFNSNKWTHDGICSYFSELGKRGYNFLYLTARSLNMYKKTRKYLVEVEQERKRLPRGPICCTMKNKFRSILMAVSRLEDHFKSQSLRNVSDMFSENPFVAAFGNTSRDLKTYLNLEIPMNFIINSKSSITVNENTTYVNGYEDLEKKIDVMFPNLFE